LNENGEPANVQTILHALSAKSENIFHAVSRKSENILNSLRSKSSIRPRYSVLNDNDQLFAAKYLTYMPTEEELRREIEQQKEFFLLQHKEDE
jgi:hypothetical protein